MTIRVERNFYHLRVYFGEALHLHIDNTKFLGMQAWQDGECECSIEFALTDGSMCVEYDSEAKWLEVLRGLERVL